MLAASATGDVFEGKIASFNEGGVIVQLARHSQVRGENEARPVNLSLFVLSVPLFIKSSDIPCRSQVRPSEFLCLFCPSTTRVG